MHGFPVICNLNRIIMIEAQKHGCSTRGYVNQLFLMNFSCFLLAADPMMVKTLTDISYMAYFFVHSFASWLYFSLEQNWISSNQISFDFWQSYCSCILSVSIVAVIVNTQLDRQEFNLNDILMVKESMLHLSVLKMRAISGTRGSSGLGSHNREQMDRRTLDTVRAGDHWERRMSRQMAPLELMLGW